MKNNKKNVTVGYTTSQFSLNKLGSCVRNVVVPIRTQTLRSPSASQKFYIGRRVVTIGTKYKGCISQRFLIIKPTRCTNFSNLFWNESLHVSDNSFVHHQELFTVHTAMVRVYVIQVCRQLSSRIRTKLSSIQQFFRYYQKCVPVFI